MTRSGAVGKHVVVHGTVQGVGFRAWTEREARALHLVGWVKNAADGTVECMLQGEEQNVFQMLDVLRRGPQLASVERIEVTEAAIERTGSFRITR